MLAIRYAETARDKAEARTIHLAAHQAYLRSGLVEILQSGPLIGLDGPSGALLVAEVADLATLRRFSDADPFVVHGVYATIRILQWTRTIG